MPKSCSSCIGTRRRRTKRRGPRRRAVKTANTWKLKNQRKRRASTRKEIKRESKKEKERGRKPRSNGTVYPNPQDTRTGPRGRTANLTTTITPHISRTCPVWLLMTSRPVRTTGPPTAALIGRTVLTMARTREAPAIITMSAVMIRVGV
jgi:hypothetical protein